MQSLLLINGNPVAPSQPEVFDTPVPWWSFTKTVLAAAALTLVRDGLVGLDDTVDEGPFTLRQLLRHEAGLADYGELADYHRDVADQQQPWTAEDMLQRLDASRLRYMPGQGWGYSNVGYMFVARLIERVTSLPLEDALAQRVLAPLEMSRVRLAKTAADLNGSYHPGWVYHGLLLGPLADAAGVLDRLLAGQILPAALLKEMQAARVLGGPIPGRPWLTPGYALGLMQGGVEHGLTLCGHTGAGPGSVVAVYRGVNGQTTATCAVFSEGADQGMVEAEGVRQLISALGVNQA